LANLVSNAIKYAPEGTTVHLRSEASEGQVVIAVRDEGPGIPREHLDRLFERFYRVDRARSRDRGGTGLGLSIVKHIAAAHDGKVEVSSEIGEGSEFRLVLPIQRDGDSTRESLGADELAALLGN
jgi:two-component system phosphate regulon sensor histidine kinase PhoR